MKLLFRLAVVGMLTASGELLIHAQASIEGHVQLPSEPSIEVINKRYAISGEQAVIAPDPPAAVVYLDGTFPTKKSPPPAQMAQKNMDFIPRLLPVQVGTTVSFPNFDNTYHSIFSFSKPKRFDLGRYRSDETPVPSVLFDKSGAVVLHCDIHEHMRAIILVLETPYFQRTDPTGAYRIVNLPAGHYTFKAWLNDKTTLDRPVDLKNGETLHVDFP
jgi:plastocyanin